MDCRSCLHLFYALKVFYDSLDMKVDDGLDAGAGLEEGEVGGVVHEEVFGEDGGAEGVTKDVEVFFVVGFGGAVEAADFVALEVFVGGLVEVPCQEVCLGDAWGGVG